MEIKILVLAVACTLALSELSNAFGSDESAGSRETRSSSKSMSRRSPLLGMLFGGSKGKSGSSGGFKPGGSPIVRDIIGHAFQRRKSTEDSIRRIVESFFGGLFKFLGSLG